jgi:hypothetical protein
MFQFVFLHLDLDRPFTLHTILPQHCICFSRLTASDLLVDRSRYLSGRVVMVQEADGIDFDEFFTLLDVVSACYTCSYGQCYYNDDL